jgi:hypothetical protein
MHAQDDPELAGMFEDIQYVPLVQLLEYRVLRLFSNLILRGPVCRLVKLQ